MLSPSTASLSSLIAAQVAQKPSADKVEEICAGVVRDLKEEAEKVRSGQGKVLMRMVGEVMKRAGGKADAKKVAGMLKGMLEKD